VYAQLMSRFERMRGRPADDAYVGGRTLIWLKVKQRDYRMEERGWDPRTNRSPHAPLAAPPRSFETIGNAFRTVGHRAECIQGGFIRTGGPCG
jgi:hypothetical protein